MPRSCTICGHAQRAAIEAALVARQSLRDIASRYGTSTAAIMRHRDNCIQGAVSVLQAEQDKQQARSVLDQIISLQRDTLSILGAAKRTNKLGTAVMAITAARQNLELLAKLTGELDTRPEVNILVHPQWIEVRTAVLGALAAHPVALEAVQRALTLQAG